MSTRCATRAGVAGLFGFALACLGVPVGAAPGPPTVDIYAAASTTDAVRSIADRYERDHDVTVRTVVAASSTVAKQIAAGAPADIYLSANVDWMDWLEARGAVRSETRRVLLRNRLVVVAPKGAAPMPALSELRAYLGERRLAMGDPAHVPAGMYAREALRSLGLWADVRGRTAYGSDVRAALVLVGQGEAAAGLVYATDARISDDVRVVARVPQRHHTPIRYPVAIVAGRDQPAVRDVFAYLQGETAARVWREHGFERADGETESAWSN
jgi:molybdate transport system substrate-binding protein